MRLLLIEDDAILGGALSEFLGDQGYAVDWLTSAEPADVALDDALYSLILLDLNLPGQDGLSFLRKIRERNVALPVIILTARDALDERIAGLDAGADDYLTKPFELPELAARVRAHTRRQTGQVNPLLEVGQLSLDTVGREIRVNDVRLPLSVREFSVLEMLMNRAGRVVTKRQIVGSLSAWDADFSENAVEVYIYRLRKRLEGTGATIQTVRGFGYLLDVHAQQE